MEFSSWKRLQMHLSLETPPRSGKTCTATYEYYVISLNTKRHHMLLSVNNRLCRLVPCLKPYIKDEISLLGYAFFANVTIKTTHVAGASNVWHVSLYPQANNEHWSLHRENSTRIYRKTLKGFSLSPSLNGKTSTRFLFGSFSFLMREEKIENLPKKIPFCLVSLLKRSYMWHYHWMIRLLKIASHLVSFSGFWGRWS